MESKRLKNLYNAHLNDLVAFSEQADYLTEQSKREFLGYKIKEFKDALTQEHNREEFLKKGANKLYRKTLKAMRQELKSKTKQRKQKLKKLAVQTKYGSVDDVTVIENCVDCEVCAHCFVNDNGEILCDAYNLAFRSDELRKQFCACYCSAYEQLAEDEAETTADNNDVEEVTKTFDDELQKEQTENNIITCCKDCESFKKEDCYCSKYGEYLDASETDTVRCCEQDDFFYDEDEGYIDDEDE
ncbi:MAG: hypothetical protein NC332_04340 [Firmicutes bacterium]|nr:hypothetical protein [Bacillota bacterium]